MTHRLLPIVLALPALFASTPLGTRAWMGVTPAEPVFDPAQSQMLFSEDFDAYTFATLHPPCDRSHEPTHRIIDHSWYYCTSFSTNGGPGVDNGVTVVPGRSGNGVAWHYDGAYQETHGVVTTAGSVPATGKKTTVVQYWAKFTPDAGYSLTHVDPGCHCGDAIVQIKNIMLWHDLNGDNGRFQIMTHAHAGCSYGPSYTMLGVTDVVDSACHADQPIGPFFKDFANSQWHRWTILYKPNTAQGSRDGMARLWIDGTLVIRIDQQVCVADATAESNQRIPGGWKAWCNVAQLDGIYSGQWGIRALEWGANRTDGSGIKFTMAIDDVKWWVAKS